ncbi:magnesium transporter NIPA-domain-containing protein [Chytridium lagenaria]|nr:magnesium transporter NIPA-domain-containing protein [Chytridium lagenaria]
MNESYIPSATELLDTPDDPHWYKPVGIFLALASGFFIGSSFIFKKRGLLDSQAKHGEIGAGHSYLSSPLWWTGMILMALGEVANFGAYAFVPAILVTPLGALSVVISAILSSIFLKERLNFSGKVGCAQCLLGATLIVIHAPESNVTETIPDFMSYVLTPGFLIYTFVCGAYGDKNPLVYISICSTVGSFLVLSIQGFGSCVVYSSRHWRDDNQFLYWQMYLLFAFIIFTVVAQIHFLNKALNLFSTAIVTPVYYVFFTTMTLISSAILFRGFSVPSITSGLSLIFGFLVIVGGVVVLFQYQTKSAKAQELKEKKRKYHKRTRACATCKGSGREKRTEGDADNDSEDPFPGDNDDEELSDLDDEISKPATKLKKLETKTNFKVIATSQIDSPTTIVDLHQNHQVDATAIVGGRPPKQSITNAARAAASLAASWIKPSSPNTASAVPLRKSPSTVSSKPAGQWSALPSDEAPSHLPPRSTSTEYPPPSSAPQQHVRAASNGIKTSTSSSFQRVVMTASANTGSSRSSGDPSFPVPSHTASYVIPPLLPPPPPSAPGTGSTSPQDAPSQTIHEGDEGHHGASSADDASPFDLGSAFDLGVPESVGSLKGLVGKRDRKDD